VESGICSPLRKYFEVSLKSFSSRRNSNRRIGWNGSRASLTCKSDRVVYSEAIWIGERLRDIGSLSDGTLVLFTDSTKLIFLSVDAEKLATDKREWPPQMRAPLTGCQGCH
jgi:hypothetical protein